MRPNTPASILGRAQPSPGPLPTPCLIFPKVDRLGYGQAKLRGRSVKVHRVAWEAAHGPTSAGMVLDHLCRRPACCAVDHLEVVTQRENVLRGESPAAKNAAKETCNRGHALSGANLRLLARPRSTAGVERVCRTCEHARVLAYRSRTAAACG